MASTAVSNQSEAPKSDKQSFSAKMCGCFAEKQTITPITSADLQAMPAKEILLAVKFAQQAYLNPDKTQQANDLQEARDDQVEGFPLFLEDKATGANGYIWLSKSTGVVHLVYRGTQVTEKADILSDLNVIPVKLFPKDKHQQNIQVHEGFLKQFDSMEKTITKMLEDHADKYHTIVSAGHSLGAGIATISAVYFANKFPALTHDCINIGCPRAGNPQFGTLFRKVVRHSYRFANEKDPITMLAIIVKYRHVQDSFTLTGVDMSRRSEPRTDGLRFKLMIDKVDWSKHIAEDHSCDLYYDRLLKILGPYLPEETTNALQEAVPPTETCASTDVEPNQV